MSLRTKRVAEEIKKVISGRLIRGLRVPVPGFVTIGDVDLSPDFKQAKVYFSVFGSDEEVQNAGNILGGEVPYFKKELATKLRLRAIPNLVFVFDV